MKYLIILAGVVLFLVSCENNPCQAQPTPAHYVSPDSISLSLQYRDAAGAAFEKEITVSPAQLAIVVVDMWNSHGCSTMLQKSVELIPLMNQTLEAARKLGIQVVFAPSDCQIAEKWADKTQRTRVQALETHPLPPSNGFHPAKMPGWGSPCMCPVTSLQADMRKPIFACKKRRQIYQSAPPPGRQGAGYVHRCERRGRRHEYLGRTGTAGAL